MNRQDRIDLIKSYLKRLGAGEDLKVLRKEFRNNFKDVDPSEILAAEESLIKDGAPIEELQKLCDLHSALFHEEDDDEVKGQEERQKTFENKDEITAELIKEDFHPLNTFERENQALKKLIAQAKDAFENGKDFYPIFAEMKDLSIHYAKKGDLLYPLLEAGYDIVGPSNVMWTVDGEIRSDIKRLLRNKDQANDNIEDFKDLLNRIEEMIFKEEKILFPNCAVNFTEDQWIGIYKDMKDYDPAFGVEGTWAKGEEAIDDTKLDFAGEEVHLSGGSLKINELNALLNTIPAEITFVDKDNINKYFNDGEKLMKRPKMALGRNVMTCHPPKVQVMVNSIIEDFRNGLRNNVPVWMEKAGKTLYINYIAVRDEEGQYVGTLELVQDMTFAKDHFKNC
ncbi:DUF438 domain-containing protein [Neofamilia massiliensis]|uniref:DUF438 domain-containing protein n=1 Tax=Neofamilia massiliensis TaxID=1673724 RepID=UPI0006BB772E|nr:DUF438 domain-containing protein [Neofamilia massiliensis]